MTYEQLWLRAFLLTQAVEIPIYTLILSRFPARPLWQSGGSDPLSLPMRILCAFLASAITHPWVWYFFPRYIDDYWPMVAVAETFAVVVEALWLQFCGLRRALLWSLVANGTSATLGFLRQ